MFTLIKIASKEENQLSLEPMIIVSLGSHSCMMYASFSDIFQQLSFSRKTWFFVKSNPIAQCVSGPRATGPSIRFASV